jgi:adenosylhomocysteine nucleosidase
MKTIVLISANAEWHVVLSLFLEPDVQHSPVGEYFETKLDGWQVTFFHSGWGKVSSGAASQYVIDLLKPDLLVNLGTCGGFEGLIERGTIILAEKTIIYDILEQMTDPEQAIEHYSTNLDLSWLPSPLPFPVLRGLLVSGDRDLVPNDIPMLIGKYKAVAADWESGAIAWVAHKNQVKCLILRGVSDLVTGYGGEAYGDYDLFIQRTKQVMKRLVDELPKWLQGIEKAAQGDRV